jgi:hypothetical protein
MLLQLSGMQLIEIKYKVGQVLGVDLSVIATSRWFVNIGALFQKIEYSEQTDPKPTENIFCHART